MKVYTKEQWRKDGCLKVKRGQFVDNFIFEQLRDCVPPLVLLKSFFQCGEPYDNCPITGNPRYLTFIKESKYWKFVGYCTSYSEETYPLDFTDLIFDNKRFIGDLRMKNHKQAIKCFFNGYGVSVLFGNSFYSNGVDTYEVAILKDGHLCYSTPITDDVLPYQTKEEVSDIMKKVQML